MDAQVRERLLASVEANRLVILIGAGLSMAPPSRAPSAASVAAACFDEYALMANPGLDPGLRVDLEALAEHFLAQNTLKTVFIDRLVPWQKFFGPPNSGHAAIADLLITRGAQAALSANYDILIELCAWNYGAHFVCSLDGDEANVHSATHSPLLKFHGCANRSRVDTVWTSKQLTLEPIAGRVAKSATWMRANLREKDLLVVGFWSDWSYLNEILSGALINVSPLSVTLVDPGKIEDLQEKAPQLWALTQKTGVSFYHVAESGAQVLDEIRRCFSQGYMRRVLNAGVSHLEAETKCSVDPAWLQITNADSECLYAQRRDAEGVPSSAPATQKYPVNVELLGFFHLLLRRAGATQTSDGYELAGEKVRVINGAGAVLSTLRGQFVEAPATGSVDVVAAVGATDLALPANVIRQGRPQDILRPAASAEWFDFQGARERLNI